MEYFTKDGGDILLKMEHSDGTKLTFISAPSSVFNEQDELEVILYGLGSNEVCIAFNDDFFRTLVEESIENNADRYGIENAIALPTSYLVNIGLKAVREYFEQQRSDS